MNSTRIIIITIIPMCLGFNFTRAISDNDFTAVIINALAIIANVVYVATTR